MERSEYLKQLKNNLLSLTEDEQAEALQYYSDYFDEADDDEKVIAELGSPEELAKTIVEKFANVLTKSEKVTDGTSNDEKQSSFDALYYSFSKDSVKNISFSFETAQVVLIPGEKYSIETRGIDANRLYCHLSSEGNLSVKNEKSVNFNFFNHERKSRLIPRILITIPNDSSINRLKVFVGAGSLEARDIELKCQEGFFDVGAGNLVIKNIYGGKVDFRCGMGNLAFIGKISGKSNVDCGMGAVNLKIKGNPSDYSYDVKVGLGDFRFNDEKKSGIAQYVNNAKKENHFSVNCGMGSVAIKVE